MVLPRDVAAYALDDLTIMTTIEADVQSTELLRHAIR